MKQYRDVMFDLETMSTRPNAAILSIGAVGMDLANLRLTGESFYVNIELSSCADLGLHVSTSTQDWWAAQEQEARDALTKNAKPLRDGLQDLRNWLRTEGCKPHNVRPWGNGAAFDVVILESAYKACDMAVPWEFRNHMCYRTKKNEHYRTVPPGARVGIKHNALDDALTQAEHLFRIYRYERRPRTLTERVNTWLKSTKIPTSNRGG